jgi:uncharacterized CHY-type Zn-finger protein
MRVVHGIEVFGVDVDAETRCAHWNSELDIIAIKFKCCGRWFPCLGCHKAVADHDAIVWPAGERDSKAVLCGACGHQLSIDEYFHGRFDVPCMRERFQPWLLKTSPPVLSDRRVILLLKKGLLVKTKGFTMRSRRHPSI